MPQQVRLSYTGDYDWPAALAFLSRRAVQGVEHVVGDTYTRTIRLNGFAGTIGVAHDREARALVLSTSAPGQPADDMLKRVRHMFDLDAEVATISACLSRDPWMATLVAARPSMRVFHGIDGFEVAMRSIIGQQVSVDRARHLNGVLVERCGTELPAPPGGLGRLFPGPQQVLDANLDRMGMPGSRAAALKAVAQAALEDPGLFDRGGSIDETTTRLRAIKGIGEWTAHYIAMRACGEPDAFPSSDVGLLRGAVDAGGRRPSPAELLARAGAWRPWRAYAAHHLWAIDAGV